MKSEKQRLHLEKLANSRKGIKRPGITGENHPMWGKRWKKEEHPMWGRHLSEATKSKMRLKKLGKKRTLLERINISEGHKGSKHPNWKGGITPINARIRNSLEYKLWREAVFRKDNYTCIWGGEEHGNRLNADHIKPFALYPELRFAIDNGRALCIECHKKTDTFGGKTNYFKK